MREPLAGLAHRPVADHQQGCSRAARQHLRHRPQQRLKALAGLDAPDDPYDRRVGSKTQLGPYAPALARTYGGEGLAAHAIVKNLHPLRRQGVVSERDLAHGGRHDDRRIGPGGEAMLHEPHHGRHRAGVVQMEHGGAARDPGGHTAEHDRLEAAEMQHIDVALAHQPD
jgi:hypothetical protein